MFSSKAPETLKPIGHHQQVPVTSHSSSKAAQSASSSHVPPQHKVETAAAPVKTSVKPTPPPPSSGMTEVKNSSRDPPISADERPSPSLAREQSSRQVERSDSVESSKKVVPEKGSVSVKQSAVVQAQKSTPPPSQNGVSLSTHGTANGVPHSTVAPHGSSGGGSKPSSSPPTEHSTTTAMAPTTAEIKPAPSSTPQQPPSLGSDVQAESKPVSPDEGDTKVVPPVSHSPQVASTDNTSPTTGVHIAQSPLTAKKQKSSRKSNTKAQKPPVESASSAVAGSAPQVPVPLPAVSAQSLKRDFFERKESESSLKSTDSESTTSSLDKSDERDASESVTVPATKEAAVEPKAATTVSLVASEAQPKPTKPRQLPLAKEPNTGQTVHIDEASPGNPEIVNDKEGGNLRNKSRRKIRQQKKEEKSKKKEREKASRVKEKAEKSQGVAQGSPYSAEQFDEDTIEDVPVVLKPTKLKILQSPSKIEQNQRSRQKSLPAKQVEPVDPRSYLLDSEGVVQRSLSLATPVADNTGERDTSPPLPKPVALLSSKSALVVLSKPAQPLPSKSSAPSKSVPSTAIKSSRSGLASKPQQYSEDIISDPFSRNPDRSTYARKKTTSRKSAEKGARSASEESPVISSPKQPEAEMEIEFESKQETKSLEASDESIEEADSSTASPEASEEMIEMDSQHKNIQFGVNPSSPHDLAASLLSKIPIPVKRTEKLRSDRAKSSESLEYEDDDIAEDVTNQENIKLVDDSKEINHPNSFSPVKDNGVLSSPSPPLPSDQHRGSSLSLDAEPFYPSSNLKSTKKHSKSDRKGSDRHDGKKSGSRKAAGDSGDARMGHGQKLGSQQHHHHHHQRRTPTSAMEGSIPPVGPVDKAMLDRSEFYHQRSEKQSPPSPPFPYGEGYRYNELLYEGQDDYRRPLERDPGAYYGSSMEESLLHERARRDPSTLEPSYFVPKTGRHPPTGGQRMGGALYPQQQGFQHMPNYPRSSSSGYAPDSRMFDDDFKRQQFLRKKKFLLDLYRQERAALAAVYAREQARKSAEALSSLHRPVPRMGGFPSEMPSKHSLAGSPANLWDDYLDVLPPASQPPHARGFDDPTLMGSEADPRQSSGSYLFSDLPPTSQIPPRAHNLSEASDIGGEILSNYQSARVQSPTSVGPPGYKRAPGAEYSRMEQEQEALGKDSVAALLMEQHRNQHLAWPTLPDGEVSVLYRIS